MVRFQPKETWLRKVPAVQRWPWRVPVLQEQMCRTPSAELYCLAFNFAGEYKETAFLPESLQHEFCYVSTCVRAEVKDISSCWRHGYKPTGLHRVPWLVTVQASHSQCQKSLKSCLDPQLMANTSATETKCREDISGCVQGFFSE